MTQYLAVEVRGFFANATSTMLSLWMLLWGIRWKGELDYELDDTAKHIRWLRVLVGWATLMMSTVPRISFAWGILLGWIWATAFLAWPNFAYHLTRVLRRCKLLRNPDPGRTRSED
jgi:hypothetical protein